MALVLQCLIQILNTKLVLIHSSDSHKLNMTPIRTFIRQNGMEAEVIGVTKRLRTMKKSDVLSTTISEISIEAQGLDDLLVNAVDETLKHVFKEEGTRVIYDYLKNNSHLKREEIAEKPKAFSAGLERLMGSAAPVIEKLILKNLYGKLGLRFREKKGYGFSDYIRELEERLSC